MKDQNSKSAIKISPSSKKIKSWMTGEVFRSLDFFGKDLPSFILKGQRRVKTRIGGVVSILIFILIIMYASLKFSHLVDKHNPVTNSFYKENYYGSKEGIDLVERNVKIAFTIEDTYGVKKQKNDPRYVKWLVEYEGYLDGILYQRILQFHKCTDEDYD